MLLPLRITGSESICGGNKYLGLCVTSVPTLPLKQLIALPVELGFMTDTGQLRRVCGIITEASAGYMDGGLTTYHLVVRDALAVMEKRVNSRIFRNQDELSIMETLFDEWRRSNYVISTTFDYEFDPMLYVAQYPPREQTMQCNESDAAFVRRLLKRRGISWVIRPGRASTRSSDHAHDQGLAHKLVLFNDMSSPRQNKAGTVRYHREDATDVRDVIKHWTSQRSLQAGVLTRHSWDYDNPHAIHP